MLRRLFDAAGDIDVFRRLQVGDVALNGMMTWNGMGEGAANEDAICDLIRLAALELRAGEKRNGGRRPRRVIARAERDFPRN